MDNQVIEKSDKRKSGLKFVLPTIFFVTFTCLFYGPLSTYLPNAEEIWFNIGTLLKVIVPFSLFAIFLMVVFFAILPEKVSAFFRKLLFGVAFALYVQGNWINVNYGSGVMDGSAIPWEEYTTYGILNTFIWVLCIILPFIISMVIKKLKADISIDTIIVVASLFLTAIQIPALIMQYASYQPNTSADLRISSDHMYEISGEENIIYIMLDAMDQEYFDEYLERNPGYKDELKGFVSFDNTLSSGAKTMIGLPSMFTGHPFMRQDTYSSYLDEVWGNDNAFSVLHDHGYTVRLYSGPMMYNNAAIEFVDNFVLDKGKVSSYKTLLKKVYKLDLYKFAPHFMKKKFWFNTGEFDKAKITENAYITNDSKFYKNFRDSKFVVKEDLPKLMVLYHLAGAHEPYVMAADTSRVKDGTLIDQVDGSFLGVKSLLDDLKEKGLYDSTTIIISADHGDINVSEHPILMIKEKNATAEFRESHVPASLFDVAIYLAGLVGEELPNQVYGEKIFELQEGQERERHVFVNTTGNSRVMIREYMTTSDASDRDNLVEINSYEDPNGIDTPYVLGTELSFARDATGNKYTVEGFASNTGFRTFLRGRSSKMSMPIQDPPESGTLTVSIKLHNKSNSVGPVEVYAGGELVKEAETGSDLVKSGLKFQVPVENLTEDGVLELEFLFPNIDEGANKNTISFVSMIIK